jgi:hypothetical protein
MDRIEPVEENLETEQEETQEPIIGAYQNKEIHDALNLITAERMQMYKEKQPDISRLKSAIIDGKFVANMGDNIVMELMSNGTWLTTREATIKTIDHNSGNIIMWDEVRQQHVCGNYKSTSGVVFKLGKVGKRIKKKRNRTRTDE